MTMDLNERSAEERSSSKAAHAWLSYDATIVWAMTDDLDFVRRADKPSGPFFESLLADWAVVPGGGMKEFRSAEIAQNALLGALKAGVIMGRGVRIERPGHREAIAPFEWTSLHFRSDEDGVTFAASFAADDQPRWSDLQFRTEDVIRHLRLPIVTGRTLRLRSAEEQKADQATYAVELAERLSEAPIEPDAPPTDDGRDLLAEDEWTLAMAMAWATTLRLDAVRDHWRKTDGGLRSLPATYDDVALWINYEQTVNGLKPKMAVAEAWSALVAHLRNGRLAATSGTDGAEVPTLFWRGVAPSDLPAVLVNREDVMREFPAGVVTIEGETLPVDVIEPLPQVADKADEIDAVPLNTGMAGRPEKSSGLLKVELNRRAERGEMESSLAQQVKALLEWLQSAYPTHPVPAQGTAENNLRKLYLSLKTPRNNPTK